MYLIDCGDKRDRVVGSILQRQAQACPDTVWLRDECECFTFAQAEAVSNSIANVLLRCGIGKGSVVAAMQRASARAVLLAVATMKVGAMFAPINTECRRSELEEVLREGVPKIFVVDKEFEPLLDTMPYLGDTVVFVDPGHDENVAPSAIGRISMRYMMQGACSNPEVVVLPEDPAILLRTSGTTGRSKWVMHSHSSLLFMSWQGAVDKMREGDVSYSCTAYNHMAFWTFAVFSPLVSGTTGAIDDRFTVSGYWARVRYYDASRLLLMGAMHTYVWELPESPVDRDNRVWLAYFTPIKAQMVPKFKERYGFEVMMTGYGCSEVGKVSEGVDMSWPGADTAIGKVLDYYEVAVLDECGQRCEMGVSGEICVKPREDGLIFMGYYGNQPATEIAFRDGWYLTGDMGILGEDGMIYFNGRKKDCVRHKGRNISLFEVEEVALRVTGVSEVAAFGVPAADAVSEDLVSLAVVLRDGVSVSADDIAGYIYENAPYYFVPDYIEFLSSLPRNRSGRVVKKTLEEGFDRAAAWEKPLGAYSRRRTATS